MQTTFDSQVILRLAFYYFYPKDCYCLKKNSSILFLYLHTLQTSCIAPEVSNEKKIEGSAIRSSQVIASVTGWPSLPYHILFILRWGNTDFSGVVINCYQNLRKISGSLPTIHFGIQNYLESYILLFYYLLFIAVVGYMCSFLVITVFAQKLNLLLLLQDYHIIYCPIQETFENEKEHRQ